jgi:hypothetical protein
MMLGPYKIQSPSGGELAHLVHGNRLARAAISETDKPKKLWASPGAKNILRQMSCRHEWELPNPENTAVLEQLLRDIDEDVHLPPQKLVKKTEKAKKTVRDRKSRLQRW